MTETCFDYYHKAPNTTYKTIYKNTTINFTYTNNSANNGVYYYPYNNSSSTDYYEWI